MLEILGDYLVQPEETQQQHATWDRVNPNLPSPEALRRKILIKHKKRDSKEKQQQPPAADGRDHRTDTMSSSDASAVSDLIKEELKVRL